MLASLTNFLILNPLVCLIILCSFFGWGSFISLKKQTCPFLYFSNGVYFNIIWIFILCIFKVLNVITLSITLILGFLLFLLYLKKNHPFKFSNFPIQASHLWWVIIPWLGILFIRASTPPYFIDFLQYHLPYCYEIIHHQGFTHLPHFFYAITNSNFASESIFLYPLILNSSETITLFNTCLYIINLIYLAKILKLYDAAASIPFIVLLLLSCEIYFHNAVYGKTEILLIFVTLDIILRIKKHSYQNTYETIHLGLALSFLPFLKVSMALIFIPLCIYTFYIFNQHKKLNFGNFTLLFIGGLIPLSLLIVKNIQTNQMALYPIFYNVDLLPSLYENGPKYAYQAKALDYSKVLTNTIRFFKGQFSYGFSPSYFAWFLSLGLILAIIKKFYAYIYIVTLLFIHWQYWVVTYIYDVHAFRLTFPTWVLAIVSLGVLISKFRNQTFQKGLLALILCCFCHLIYKNTNFLPGLKFHLGKQSLTEYYKNMSIPLGSINLHSFLHDLEPKQKILISSENAGVFSHPQLIYVNLSAIFDRKEFNSSESFLSQLSHENIKYIITDSTLNHYALVKWSKKSLEESKLSLIHHENGVHIYQHNIIKP